MAMWDSCPSVHHWRWHDLDFFPNIPMVPKESSRAALLSAQMMKVPPVFSDAYKQHNFPLLALSKPTAIFLWEALAKVPHLPESFSVTSGSMWSSHDSSSAHSFARSQLSFWAIRKGSWKRESRREMEITHCASPRFPLSDCEKKHGEGYPGEDTHSL